MNRKLLLALIFGLPLTFAHALRAAPPPPANDIVLRIGLVRSFGGVKQVTVATSSETLTLAAGRTGVIRMRGDAAESSSEPCVTVRPAAPDQVVTVQSSGRTAKDYRGSIEVSWKSGALQIVNVVRLEDYLLGVVPAEMPDSYPLEALKAQAIAARTYAVRNLRKHLSKGYNLSDNHDCQVYLGASAEKPNATRAVLDTQGIVLNYKGQVADVMYSGDCGGVTQSYAENHPARDLPYLCGVKEPEGIVHSCWEYRVALTDLSNALARAGIKDVGGLQSVRVARTDSSGRVRDVKLVASTGSRVISYNQLNQALGGSLRSALFVIEVLPDGALLLKGRGRGHGAGLCQVGCKALASPPYGYTHDRILAHYFPGTDLGGRTGSEIARLASGAMPKAGAGPLPQTPNPPPSSPEPTELSLRVRVEAPRL